MIKNLFLYVLLVLGLIACNLEKKKDLVKDFENRKSDNLIIPVKPAVSSEIINNNNIELFNSSIEHAKKEEIKKEGLIPFTDEEKRVDELIKNIENILRGSKFSELIKDMSLLRDEYGLIKANFNDVMGKIQSKRASLVGNYRDNKDKITKLERLQQNLSENVKLDELINKIDISKNEVISASIIFDRAKERLENSIIKRLKGKKEKSNALKLSRQALDDATIVLRNLESSLLIKIDVIGKKKEIKELIENAKAVV